LNATKEELKEMAERFEFDHIENVSGTFKWEKIKSPVDCYKLVGNIKAKLSCDEEEFEHNEVLDLYAVSKEEDVDQFPIEDDVEILTADGKIDLGEVMAQYVYLMTEIDIASKMYESGEYEDNL